MNVQFSIPEGYLLGLLASAGTALYLALGAFTAGITARKMGIRCPLGETLTAALWPAVASLWGGYKALSTLLRPYGWVIDRIAEGPTPAEANSNNKSKGPAA